MILTNDGLFSTDFLKMQVSEKFVFVEYGFICFVCQDGIFSFFKTTFIFVVKIKSPKQIYV